MGIGGSKEFESEESERLRLDQQLESLKKEARGLRPLITKKDGARSKLKEVENTIILRWNKLDPAELRSMIQESIQDSMALSVLHNTVEEMISTLHGTKKMEEIACWHSQKTVKRHQDRVYGLEFHYKVKPFEELKDESSGGSNKDTCVMIVYKYIIYIMNDNAY